MLEYKMKVNFSDDRWFQVTVTPEQLIEFKMSPNTLIVNLEERQKILIAVTTGIEALTRYQGLGGN